MQNRSAKVFVPYFCILGLLVELLFIFSVTQFINITLKEESNKFSSTTIVIAIFKRAIAIYIENNKEKKRWNNINGSKQIKQRDKEQIFVLSLCFTY